MTDEWPHGGPQTPYVPPEDSVEPGKKWKFDEEVAQVFDDMLRRSIPQYDVMRELVTDLAVNFVSPGSPVVDLGASRGEALARLKEKADERCGPTPSYYAIEISEPMLATLRERWPITDMGSHRVRVHPADLRKEYPTLDSVSATLCVLTLQFVPIEYRQRVLRDVWKSTKPGGALILVEKVLGGSADLDELFVRTYYDLKGSNGYSPEQIERKRLSLEGVLVPVTTRMNEELLRGAGFREVDLFWCWANFRGWVAVKTKEG